MFHVAIVYFYHLLVFCWMLYHSLFIHFTANDCFQFVSVVDIIEHFYWCAYAQAEIGLAGHLFQLKKKKKRKAMGQCQGFSAFWKEVKATHFPLTYWSHEPHTPSMACRQAYAETGYQMFCCMLQNNFCLWCRRV